MHNQDALGLSPRAFSLLAASRASYCVGALYSDVVNGALNSHTYMLSNRYDRFMSAWLCASRLSVPAGRGVGSCTSIPFFAFAHVCQPGPAVPVRQGRDAHCAWRITTISFGPRCNVTGCAAA
jgi:hypothetical protein